MVWFIKVFFSLFMSCYTISAMEKQDDDYGNTIQLSPPAIKAEEDMLEWKKHFRQYKIFWLWREHEQGALKKTASPIFFYRHKSFNFLFAQAITFLINRLDLFAPTVDQRLWLRMYDGIMNAPEAVVRLYLYVYLLEIKRSSTGYVKFSSQGLYKRIACSLVDDFADIQQIAFCKKKNMTFMCQKKVAFKHNYKLIFDLLLDDEDAHEKWMMI